MGRPSGTRACVRERAEATATRIRENWHGPWGQVGTNCLTHGKTLIAIWFTIHKMDMNSCSCFYMRPYTIKPTTLHSLPESLVKQPRQTRSQQRQHAMLAAGLKLTETRDWDQVTIVDIAAENGFSVGSFYTRFRDKKAYLEVLTTLVAEQMRLRMDVYAKRAEEAGHDGPRLLAGFLDEALNTYTRLRGIFRASVLNRKQLEETPGNAFLQLRLYSCEQFTRLLLPHLTMDEATARRRLGFAHQMMNSTLVNAVLTDPGPLHMNQPAFREEMIDVLLAYLDLPRQPPPPAVVPASGGS